MVAPTTLSKEAKGQFETFVLENNNNLASYLSPREFSPWESRILTSPMPDVSWPDDIRPDGQRIGQPMLHNTSIPTPISCDEAPRLPTNSMGMDVDERVRCILSYLEMMGFENFDELVRTYYSQNFGETSFLCNEQRLSRNRRLPGVIASVFGAATGWSSWERRGFYEEILKATETMLIAENLEARDDLQMKVRCVMEALRSTLFHEASAVSTLKQTITSKVSHPRSEYVPELKANDSNSEANIRT